MVGPNHKKNIRAQQARRVPRFLPSEFSSLKGLRLVAGPEVTLVNASRGGMLIESRSPLAPNKNLLLRLITKEASYLLKGRVLRSRVHSLVADAVLYRIAVVFDEEFVELGCDGRLAPPRRALPDNVIELPVMEGDGCAHSELNTASAGKPGHEVKTSPFAQLEGEEGSLLTVTMSAKRFDSFIDRVFGTTGSQGG